MDLDKIAWFREILQEWGGGGGGGAQNKERGVV